MKASNIKYLTGMGFKNMWINKLMTIASVGTLVACMIMIGVAGMLTVNINNALHGIEQENVIVCYFNDRNSVEYKTAKPLVEYDGDIPDEAYLIHNEAEAKALCDQISAVSGVVEVKYVSKEESLAAVKDNYLNGQEECQGVLDEKNPMSDGARVTVGDMAQYNAVADAIGKLPGVSSVTAQKDIAGKIEAIKGALRTTGFWIIAILVIISLVIVSNTIRVTMYNRKLEISIMKAVGATDTFIRIPFAVEGVTIGIISALLAFGLLYLMQSAVGQTLRKALQISIVPFRSYALSLLGTFVIIGIAAGLFGSVIMIGKYLKKEGSEFRAL